MGISLKALERLPIRANAAAAVVMLVALMLSAPRAGAQTAAQLDPHGVSVAASGGWSAWSRADPATGGYSLVTRSPQGVISLPHVPESAWPFDVELGPTRDSEVAAVYSRCTRAGALRSCHIQLLALTAADAAERSLIPPGGGSLHEPALWDGQLVFLRRTPSGGAHRPDIMLAWRIGSRRLQALALPSSRGNRNAGWPAGLTGRITGLTFNGKQVAYVTSNAVGVLGESSLWFEPLSGRPELIDQQTGGAGNVCPPEFLSPVLSGQWLYSYLHACDPSANPRLDRLTRYRHAEVQRATFTLLHAGDEAIGSAVPDGAAVEWDANGIERVAQVSWRGIAAPAPQSFCGRSDPFC